MASADWCPQGLPPELDGNLVFSARKTKAFVQVVFHLAFSGIRTAVSCAGRHPPGQAQPAPEITLCGPRVHLGILALAAAHHFQFRPAHGRDQYRSTLQDGTFPPQGANADSLLLLLTSSKED